jgi:glutamyl-tRNA synthetase
MADAAHYFYARPAAPLPDKLAAALTGPVRVALRELHDAFATLPWSREAVAAAIKDVAARHSLKPPQVMMGLRAAITGEPQTPAIDAIVALLDRETVQARIAAVAAQPSAP